MKTSLSVLLILMAILNIALFLLNLELYLNSRGWWNLVAMGFAMAAAIFTTATAIKE